MKHLFLEGQIQIGKSTLLRECLAPCRDSLGGFSVQRLTGPEGRPLGYRITEAWDFCIEQPYDANLPGIFLYRGENGMIQDLSVFTETALQLLEASKDAPLLLLDEIGGLELKDGTFSAVLYDTLTGETPCIGVLKSEAHAIRMSSSRPESEQFVRENQHLRQHIKACGGEIFNLPPSDKLFAQESLQIQKQIRHEILLFLQSTVKKS